MTEVLGVRFKKAGKIYYFAADNHDIEVNEGVIVETARGVEFGTVVIGRREFDETKLPSALKPIIRKATPDDVDKNYANIEREKQALEVCNEKIIKHNLSMKLVDVSYTFDLGKLIFYFTSESRVDFRELVKDLAAVFRTRIELRQIGVRDEAKMMGGYSTCGRELCCHSVLGDFEPVSIKMAKDQNLSLNPAKISGACGRLMCCLKFEHYECEKGCKKHAPAVKNINASEADLRVSED